MQQNSVISFSVYVRKKLVMAIFSFFSHYIYIYITVCAMSDLLRGDILYI